MSVVGLNTTAQQPEPASALQAVVETERSFARTSAERGIRESFLAYIAEDGLLFRPGAVNGKKWMLEHPVPPSRKRPLLSWQPAFADVARAGDLGYTFGPWEFKEDITDEKPVGYGHFVTVWKRQTDGSWKFAVDLGISHAAPKDPKVHWQLPANYKVKSWKATDKTDLDSTRASLLRRDRQFSKASATDGPVKAYALLLCAGAKVVPRKELSFRGDSGKQSGISSEDFRWPPANLAAVKCGCFAIGRFGLHARHLQS